jgi:predicted dehydrogenase
MKAAIIGMGPMGKRHVTALGHVPGLELVAVADRRTEALRSTDLSPKVRRFDDAIQLLDEVRPELVIVATNAPSHHSLVEASVALGAKAILCEKPMACSLATARAMGDACRAAGVRLAVNHCRRHVAAYGWIRERVESGHWGALRGVRIACPGTGLGCITTHFVDLAAFLSGESFVRVTSWVDPERSVNPRGEEFHDPGGLIVAEGNRGTRYIFHQIEDASGPVSIILDLTLARVVVEEREGRVSVIRRDASVKPGPGRPPKFDEEAPPQDKPLKLDVVEMTAEVLTELAKERPLTCTAENGYRSLEVIISAYLSHARGNIPVALPLEREEDLSLGLAIT